VGVAFPFCLPADWFQIKEVFRSIDYVTAFLRKALPVAPSAHGKLARKTGVTQPPSFTPVIAAPWQAKSAHCLRTFAVWPAAQMMML